MIENYYINKLKYKDYLIIMKFWLCPRPYLLQRESKKLWWKRIW